MVAWSRVSSPQESDVIFEYYDFKKDGVLEVAEFEKRLNEHVHAEAADGDKDYGTLHFHGTRDLEHRESRRVSTEPGAIALPSREASPIPHGEIIKNVATLGDHLRRVLLGDGMKNSMDVFRRWDVEGDGLIAKKEFAMALRSLVRQLESRSADLWASVGRHTPTSPSSHPC